ncbi:GNAT family N-acetyltransferase [Deinococcus hohokamensis]|uniref:GNAT family N-acetyltransferase n=1 Tax=Deinococcus hohokamensis TaxID=309883 RepID=A0ABV9ID86_9DEIO
MIDLGGGYSARPISTGAYREACARLEDQIFGGNWLYAFPAATKAPAPLGETFSWGLYHGETLIGWSHAQQRDERTVYMADTGLLPEHQGRGLYTRLLPHLLDTFREAGYLLVQSHHRATNNRVIVPKLRAGFFIQGLNLYEGGLNVALTLPLDEAYREALHVRSGFRQASGETARRLGVQPAPAQSLPDAPAPELTPPPACGPEVDLGGGYTLRPVPYADAWAVAQALETQAYDTVSFDWQAPAPHAHPTGERFAWLVLFGQQVAGWQISRQWDNRTAYMVNTALLPGHRGHGVYSRLLPVVLDTLQAAGYPLVRSHHHATNNAVLVPKLRAGFRLQGLEVGHHGVMAVLQRSFDPAYERYMDVRSGLARPQGEVAARLGLQDQPSR